MQLIVVAGLALVIGVTARLLKGRSVILWSLVGMAVMVIGEIPVRFMVYVVGEGFVQDLALQIGSVPPIGYGLMFVLMLMIVFGTRKLPPA